MNNEKKFFSDIAKQIFDTWLPKSSMLFKIYMKYKALNREQQKKVLIILVCIELVLLLLLAKIFGLTSIWNGLIGAMAPITYLIFIGINVVIILYLAKKKGKLGIRGIMPVTNREIAESTEYGSAIMMNYDDEIRDKFTVSTIDDCVEQIYGQIPETKDGTNVVSEKKMADDTVEECNILGIGKAGTGKTSTIGLPNIYQCIKRGESFACIDPKAAEIRQESVGVARENGYKAYTLNVLDPDYCDGWDFLGEVIDRTKRKGRLDATRLDMFVNVYFPNTASVGGEQAYYVEGASAYLKLIISVLMYRKEKHYEDCYKDLYEKLLELGINDDEKDIPIQKQVESLDDFKDKVKSMIQKISNSEKRKEFNDLVEIIDKTAPTATIDDVHFWQSYEELLISMVELTPSGHPARQALKTIKDTLLKVPNGWIGFKQNLATRLSMFNNESLRMAMSTPNINLRTINKEKTALYIVCKDGDSTFRAILSLFFAFMMMDIKEEYDLAEQKAKESCSENPSIPVYMFLDEMYSVGAIGGLPSKKGEATFLASQISTIRSRKINMTMLFQSHSQLEEIYGKEAAHTIKMNTNCKLFLGGTETDTTNYFSELLGDTTVLTESHSETDMLLGTMQSNTSNVHAVKSRLMTPEEIGHLPNRMILLCHGRDNPVLLNTFYYKNHPMYREDKRINLFNDVVPISERIEKEQIKNTIHKKFSKVEEVLTAFSDLEKTENQISQQIHDIDAKITEGVTELNCPSSINEEKATVTEQTSEFASDADVKDLLNMINKTEDSIEENDDLYFDDLAITEDMLIKDEKVAEQQEEVKENVDRDLEKAKKEQEIPPQQTSLFPQEEISTNKKATKRNKKTHKKDIDI
jgi:type IV secretory pathway TraG/TraD family ATPase VirD4